MSGKRIGYIRICGKDKNENKQLHAMALDVIFTDTELGKNAEQTQLAAAIDSATMGDQVFVDSITRLGTSKMDALRIVTEFTSRGASLTSVKEGLVFTPQEEPISILIKTLLLEFKPAKPLSKKESSPPVTAKKTKKTSKVTLTPKQIAELKRRANAGENKTALAKHFAVSRASLLAYLR